jgi:hypothetical protein
MGEEEHEVHKRVVYEQSSTTSDRQNWPVIIAVLVIVAVLVYFILEKWS